VGRARICKLLRSPGTDTVAGGMDFSLELISGCP
jgi:hypothetical protein